MSKIKFILNIVYCLVILSALAASNTLYVAADSPNDPGSGTYDDPFRRIQDAINAAAEGDTVEIRPGLYTGYRNYDLDPSGKSVTIRSVDEPNAPENTIIDAAGNGCGFYFSSGENTNCVIRGLTIRNGYAGTGMGGAISCYYSSPVIMDCILENNYADFYGGAVYSYDASPKFIRCVIKNNQAGNDGGGLEVSGGEPELVNCIIANNQAAGFGGGCDFFYECQPVLLNCTIAGNNASSGGGVCGTDSHILITNSILWGNEALQGSQLSIKDWMNSASASVDHSDIQGGQSEVFDPCSVLNWSSSNINTYPDFVSFDPDGSPETWDFHLLSIYGHWDTDSQTWIKDTNISPCIDRGNPGSQWGGEPWPNGKRINMGAYGGTSQASKNGNPADFNVDNIVDISDFLEMSEQWLTGHACIEDLNLDEEVNTDDLFIFIENWLWEKDIPADFNRDTIVDLIDFSNVSEKWLVSQNCYEDLNFDGQVNSPDLILFSESWLRTKR